VKADGAAGFWAISVRHPAMSKTDAKTMAATLEELFIASQCYSMTFDSLCNIFVIFLFEFLMPFWNQKEAC